MKLMIYLNNNKDNNKDNKFFLNYFIHSVKLKNSLKIVNLVYIRKKIKYGKW